MIQFRDFKKSYNSQLILDIKNIDIHVGVYWLKGINGSGKSTLLRSLAGIIPYDGLVTIAGIDIRKDKQAHRRLVNYAEAAPVYPLFLTGFELINFYVETLKGNRQQCLDNCAALRLDEIALKKEVGTYSSGMLKKLSLVLAFAGNPQWILLDEPLITLDVAATQIILQWVENAYHAGTGLLLTSHQDMDFPTHNLPLQMLETTEQTVKKLLI